MVLEHITPGEPLVSVLRGLIRAGEVLHPGYSDEGEIHSLQQAARWLIEQFVLSVDDSEDPIDVLQCAHYLREGFPSNLAIEGARAAAYSALGSGCTCFQ